MIQTIEIARLRNAEYIQFSKQFLAIINLNNAVTLKVGPEYAEFDAVTKAIEALFKLDQGSNITPGIEALDARRDAAVMGMYSYVDAHVYHFQPTKREAATVLMNQLKVYGTATSVSRNGLAAETAIITSLVGDFTNKAAFKQAVDELALMDWLTELQAVNNLLEQKYIDRTVELGRANPNSIRDKRVEANTVYYVLRNMLVSQATVLRNADPYPKTINELNALIAQYNVVLAGRVPGSTPIANEGVVPASL